MTTYKYYWKTVLLFLLLNSNYSFGQIVETFSTPGSFTWTCPANVTQVVVDCWGGGGGGGNSANNTINGGSGGGGGAYAKKTFSVVPGNAYYLTVGGGGTGAPAYSNVAALYGGDSWFNTLNSVPTSNNAVLAKGGSGGFNNAAFSPNNGGSGLNSFGDVLFAGGSGRQALSSGGGGGGSAASSNANGVWATSALGAISGGDGGNGGNGSTTSSSNGSPGMIPGGGGGGSDDWQARFGGNGGDGMIKLTYFINCSGTPNSGSISISSPNGCEGLSVTLSASSLSIEQGITYQWQQSTDSLTWADISDATNTTFNITPTTSLYFRVKSFCSFSESLSYSQSLFYTVYPIPIVPLISSSGNTTFCQGDSVLLSTNIVSGLSYQWNNDGVNISGATNNSYIANLSGVYSLLATSAFGCSAISASTIVTVNPNPSATVTLSGPTTFCQGGALVLNENSGTGQSYQWLNNGVNISGATSANYTASTIGVYSVVINNSFGCSSTSLSTNVSVISYPPATIDSQGISVICNGGTILLSSNTGTGLTYQWRNNGTPISGATSSTYSAVSAGTYSVIVTNSGLCSTTSNSIVITQNQLTFTFSPTSASMNTGYVTSVGTKNTGNLLVSTSTTYGRGWAKFPLTSIPSGSQITGVTIQFYTFGGTSSTTSNTIRGFTGDPVTMTGSTLYTTIGSGTIYNTSTWTIGTSTSPSVNSKALSTAGVTFVQNQLSTGYVNFGFVGGSSNLQSIYGYINSTYRVRLEITFIPPAPSATLSANSSTTFCQGGSVIFSTNSVNGNSYQWRNSGNIISGASASSYTASASGVYTVRVTNTSGCSTISNGSTVTVNPLPTVTLTNAGPVSFCQGASVLLNANSNGTTFQWKKNGVNISGATASTYTANTSGSYTVFVTNSFGCSNTSNSINVTVYALPNPIISGITSFCQGDTSILSINSTSGITYQWRNNGVNIIDASNYFYAATSPGSYSVFVINANGCSSTSPSVSVTVNQLPTSTISASNATTFCQGGSTNLTADNNVGLSYQWYKNGLPMNGNNSLSYSATTSGNYNVYFTNSNGCSNYSSNSITVTVLSLPNLSISGDSIICQGETTNLTASSNGTISWNGNLNQNSIQVSPNVSTTYSVSSVGSNGCTIQDQVLVIVNYPSDTTIYTSSYGPFELNGQIYQASGIYTQDLETIKGCDSTVTIHLNYITNSLTEEYNSLIHIVNPVNENTIVIVNDSNFKIELDGVFDINGKKINVINSEIENRMLKAYLPNSITPGVYLLKFQLDGFLFQRKILII